MATTQIEPPPTYADVLLRDASGRTYFNPIWLKWFIDLAAVISSSGGAGGTIQHNSLAGLQGGQANEFFHLTSADSSAVVSLVGAGMGLIAAIAAGSFAARILLGTASQIQVSNGDGIAGNPTLSFLPTSGWTACTGTALRTGWATGSATLVQVAETVKALIDDLMAKSLLGA